MIRRLVNGLGLTKSMSSFTSIKTQIATPKTPRVHKQGDRDASGAQLEKDQQLAELRAQVQKIRRDRSPLQNKIIKEKGLNIPSLLGRFDAEVEAIEQLGKAVSTAGLPKALVMEYYSHLSKKRRESLRSFQTAVKAMSNPEEISLEELNKFSVLSQIVILSKLSQIHERYQHNRDQLHQQISDLNNIHPNQANKVLKKITSHPTNPNSEEDILALESFATAYESGELIDRSFLRLHDTFLNPKFKNPTYRQESRYYNELAIRNTFQGISAAYDIGFENPSRFIERMRTWVPYDADNHPGFQKGQATETHGSLIGRTCGLFIKEIENCNEIPEELKEELVPIFDDVRQYGEILSAYALKYIERPTELTPEEEEVEYNRFISEMDTMDLSYHETLVNCLLPEGKIKELFNIFGFQGIRGEWRIAAEDLDPSSPNYDGVYSTAREMAAISNSGGLAGIVIANYSKTEEYDTVKKFSSVLGIRNAELIPLLETFEAMNETDSEKTMVAGSDMRQREAIRTFWKMPSIILTDRHSRSDRVYDLGRGHGPGRGGGSLALRQLAALSTTPAERTTRTYTEQGYLAVQENLSPLTSFRGYLNEIVAINNSEPLDLTEDYVESLERHLGAIADFQVTNQSTDMANDWYQPAFPLLSTAYSPTGSRVKGIKHTAVWDEEDNMYPASTGRQAKVVKSERAIPQAALNSSHLTWMHPDLAGWNLLTAEGKEFIADTYAEGNQHIRYMFASLALLYKQTDPTTSAKVFDSENPYFQEMVEGRNALGELLSDPRINLGPKSELVMEMWNEHLGLPKDATQDLAVKRETLMKKLWALQFQPGIPKANQYNVAKAKMNFNSSIGKSFSTLLSDGDQKLKQQALSELLG